MNFYSVLPKTLKWTLDGSDSVGLNWLTKVTLVGESGRTELLLRKTLNIVLDDWTLYLSDHS